MVPDPIAVWNERVKIFANFVSALGLGLFGFGVLRPLTDSITSVSWLTLWWGVVGLAVHSFSHYLLGYMRKVAS